MLLAQRNVHAIGAVRSNGGLQTSVNAWSGTGTGKETFACRQRTFPPPPKDYFILNTI